MILPDYSRENFTLPDEKFLYFREHIHEDEDSEFPFPYLIL